VIRHRTPKFGPNATARQPVCFHSLEIALRREQSICRIPLGLATTLGSIAAAAPAGTTSSSLLPKPRRPSTHPMI